MSVSSKRANGDTSPLPTKKVKLDFGSDHMVIVLVGPLEISFAAHKDVLCTSSDYFAAACSTRWEEGREGVVKLPEADPEAFQVFLHWAYRNELEFSYMTEPEAEEGCIVDPPSYLTLGKSWAFAHYLQCIDLCNAINDRIIEEAINSPRVNINPGTMNIIWDITPAESTIQSLLLQITELGDNLYELLGKDRMPQKVILHFARKFADGEEKRESLVSLKERCLYHEHEDGERCSN